MEVRGSLSTGKSCPESDISSERVQPTQPPAGQTAEKRLPEAMTRLLQTFLNTWVPQAFASPKDLLCFRMCLSLSTLAPAFPSAR